MALTGHRKKRNLIGRDNHVRSAQPPMSANTTLECITRYSGEYTCTSTTRENQNEVVKFKDMDVFHMHHNIHSIQDCFGIYTHFRHLFLCFDIYFCAVTYICELHLWATVVGTL